MFKAVIEHYKSSFSGLAPNVWILTITTLINRSGSMVLFFLMLYLTQDLNLTVEKAGLITSFYGIGSTIGALSGGWLSDKIGTKKVMLNSLLTGGILYIILGYIHNLNLLSAMLVVLAIISESFRPAIMTALANSCKPQNMARGFALIRLAINLGVTIGPAVGGILALYDYIYIFWVEGITCILAGVYLYFSYHERKITEHHKLKSDGLKIKSPWKDFLYLQLLLIMMLTGIVFNQIFNTWPVFLRESYSLTEDQIGLMLALNAIIIVIFEMPLIHKAEVLPILKVTAVGSLLICTGLGLVMLHSSIWFVAATVVIFTIGEMLSFPLTSSFIANRAEGAKRGQYMGLMTLTFSLSFVIGPVVGSYIFQNFGPDTLWLIIIAIGFVTFAGFLGIEKRVLRETKQI